MSSRKQRQKEDKKEPIEELTKWVNSHLEEYGEEMTDISYDFCDGVLLCHVISSVCKTSIKVPFPDAKDVFQKRKNISAAMTYLENNRYIDPGRVKRDDILWGEVYPTYNLLRMVNMRIEHGYLPPLPPGKYKRLGTARQGRSNSPTRQPGRGAKSQRENEGDDAAAESHGLAMDPTEQAEANFVPREKMRSLHTGQLDDVIAETVVPENDYKVRIRVTPTLCKYRLLDSDGERGDEKTLKNVVMFKGDDVMVGDLPVGLGEDADNETVIRDVVKVLGVESMDDLQGVDDKIGEDAETHRPLFVVGDDGYTAEQIAALLFQQIKDNVSGQADEEVVKANIAVPSYFTDAQKQALKEAAEMSGLNVESIENDDSAALDAADMVNGNRKEQPKKVLVFDMSRGACAATALKLEGRKYNAVKSAGDCRLGGSSFDDRLAGAVAKEFRSKAGRKFNPRELVAACEKAKIDLSSKDKAKIEQGGVSKLIKRSEFDDCADDLFKQALAIAKEAADGKVDQVIFKGPSTNMVKLRKMFADAFGPDTELIDGNLNRTIVLEKEKPKSKYALELNMAGKPYSYKLVKKGSDPIGESEITPVVCFRDNQISVGEIPPGWLDDRRSSVIDDVVPIIGRDFNDQKLNNDVMRYRCPVEDVNKKPKFVVDYQGQKRQYAPEDIQAMIFEHIKAKILDENDENVVDAVITVPGYLTDEQKQAISKAAAAAGLNIVRFREDNSDAVAKANKVNARRKDDAPKNVIVFNMNAGETTATALTRDGNKYKPLRTAGNGNLGGSNFDRQMADKFEMDQASQSRKVLSPSEKDVLIGKCEKAKKTLSTEDEATIEIGTLGGHPFERCLRRGEFEELCDGLFHQCLDPVKDVLHAQNIPKRDLAQVILTGGPTKMPKLRELFCQYLGSGAELIDGDTNERIITKYNQPKSDLVVGIDLGTETCRYSVFRDDGSDQSVKGSGVKELQSVVCFSGGKTFVGEIPPEVEADPNAVIIRDFKRIIGRDFTDPKLKDDVANFSCEVEKDHKTGRPVFVVPLEDGSVQKFSPEQITSMLLQRVKELVSEDTGENIIDAVVSVPAFFANAQRQATKDAGTLAGLNVIRVVNDPVAAALSYNAEHQEKDERDVVVIDMGAGKIDVALLKLQGGCCTSVATAGNTSLGGIDFDRRIARKIVDEIKEQTGQDPHEHAGDMHKIHKASAQAKVTLCSKARADIDIDDLSNGKFNRSMGRDEFDEMCEDLFQECLNPVKEVFNGAPVSKDNVKKVILVGKATKMPRFRELLVDFFGPDVELFDLDENAAVDGAAIQGAMMKGNKAGKLNGLQVRNSTPLSFGISLANGTNNIIIPRGSAIPAKFSTPATTVKDGQRNVGFDVVEGERPIAADCIKLGHVTVEGIQIAKRGVPKLEVTMEINEDGMLVVTGKDLKTGAAMTVRITNSANLSEEEIEKLLEESEAKKEEDKQKRRMVEAKMQYKYLLERGEKLLRESRKITTLPPNQVQELRRKVTTEKLWIEAHESEDPPVYKKRYEELKAELKKLE